jgi:hypothetical protein
LNDESDFVKAKDATRWLIALLVNYTGFSQVNCLVTCLILRQNVSLLNFVSLQPHCDKNVASVVFNSAVAAGLLQFGEGHVKHQP